MLPFQSLPTESPPPPPYTARDQHSQYNNGSFSLNPIRPNVLESVSCQDMGCSFGYSENGQLEYFADGNISMLFAQRMTSGDDNWQAFVKIQADDLGRVMREGLHWTEANLDREAGYIDYNPQSSISSLIPPFITCARVFVFRDLAREPQWTAKMTVLCRDLPSLSLFRFSDLTVDHIAFCTAKDADGKMVYMFGRVGGCFNMNTLYDDMPLEGWWPWPKRAEAHSK